MRTCIIASEAKNSVGYSSAPVTSGSYNEANSARANIKLPMSFFNITRIQKWNNHINLTKITNMNSSDRFTKHGSVEGAVILFFWNMHDSYFFPSRGEKVDTPKKIVEKYCPRSENGNEKVDDYIKQVCNFMSKAVGKRINPNTKLSFNESNMKALARIMCMIESGKRCVEVVDSAWRKYKENILNA